MKRIRKRIVALFLACVLILSVCASQTVYATETLDISNSLDYQCRDCTESKEECVQEEVEIPDEEPGYEESGEDAVSEEGASKEDISEGVIFEGDASEQVISEEAFQEKKASGDIHEEETEYKTEEFNEERKGGTYSEETEEKADFLQMKDESDKKTERESEVSEMTKEALETKEELEKQLEDVRKEAQSVVSFRDDYLGEPMGTVLHSGNWGDGYRWYVYQGPKSDRQKHYVFCLDHGYTMYGGYYSFSMHSGVIGLSEKLTFQIAVAMQYFKSLGGWGSPDGYEDAQRAVWGTGGTPISDHLIRYAYALWELTELNAGRSASAESYLGVTPIKKDNISLAYADSNIKAVRLKENAGACRVNHGTVDIRGSAWKYFAAGADGFGDIEITGCYGDDGSLLGEDVIQAEIKNNGKLDVSFQANEQCGTASHPITVVMQVKHQLSGATQLQYLDCGSGKQRMGYDMVASSPAYFAIRIYTGNDTIVTYPKIAVHKVDELGNSVEGATFMLACHDYFDDGSQTNYEACIQSDANGYIEFPEIKQKGVYTLTEMQPPAGMQGIGVIGQFRATETSGGIVLSSEWKQDSVMLEVTENGGRYTYTVANTYQGGNAVLHKLGNVFVEYKNGSFVYKERDLDGVSFDLYAAKDIFLGDTLLFSSDTKITQSVIDQSIWNTTLGHGAIIPRMTDAFGRIRYEELPLGSYYLVETGNVHNETSPGYGVFGVRLPFTIDSAEEDIQINQNGVYVNEPVLGKCVVRKVAKDSINADADVEGGESEKLPLQGAEFTLYAHVDNVNYDGNLLFQVEQTVPAVIRRTKEGDSVVEKNVWVPIDTVISNPYGVAEFTQKLPYGRYMVVETYPPDGYCFPEGDSYQFEHYYDRDKSYSSGAIYTHTFEDEESAGVIVVRKSGEVLTRSVVVDSEYGPYKRLEFCEQTPEGIRFALYDGDMNWIEDLVTNDSGEAVSRSLAPGVYYVKEVDNGGTMELVPEIKRIELKKDERHKVMSKTVSFNNQALSTRLRIYKTAEYLDGRVLPLGEISQTDELYSYKNAGIEGVVFGVYTAQDICNYGGVTIVKKDSCMGYCVTGEDGIAIFTQSLCEGDYYYKEIRTAGEEYVLEEGTYGFSVSLEGEHKIIDLNKENPLLNHLYKGSISVIKKGGEQELPLEGVRFALYDDAHSLLGRFVTDRYGRIRVGELPLGTYYLQELSTLEHYILNEEEQCVVLTRDNKDEILTIVNERKSVPPEEKPDTPNEKPEESVPEEEIVETPQMVSPGAPSPNTVEQYDKELEMVASVRVPQETEVRTGDEKMIIIAWLGMLALTGLCVLRRRKKYLLALAVLMTFLSCNTCFAAEMGTLITTEHGTGATRKLPGYIEWNGYIFAFANERGIPLTYKIEEDVDGFEKIYSEDRVKGLVLVGRTEGDAQNPASIELPVSLSFVVNPDMQQCVMVSYKMNGSQKTFCLDSRCLNGANMSLIASQEVTLPVFGTYWIRNVQVPKQVSLEDGTSSYICDYTESPYTPKGLRVNICDVANSKHVIGYQFNPSMGSGDVVYNRLLKDSSIYIYNKDFANNITLPYQELLNGTMYSNDSPKIGPYTLEYGKKVRNTITTYYGTGLSQLYEEELHYFEGVLVYELNGGMNAEANPTTYIINKGCDIQMPSRKDYVFLGWYTSPDFAENSSCEKVDMLYRLPDTCIGDEMITLYAKWEYQVDLVREQVNYRIHSNGRVSVESGDYSGRISLVDFVEYGGHKYPVTEIGNGAFLGSPITSITIPDGYTYIADNAFEGSSLREVYMNSMTLSLGQAFPKSVNLYAYGSSKAYQTYVENGYEGEAVPYSNRIQYVLNGGVNNPLNPDRYMWKSTVEIKPATKANCRFDGWYMDAAFQENLRVDRICRDTCKDIILYAKFTPMVYDVPQETAIVGAAVSRPMNTGREEAEEMEDENHFHENESSVDESGQGSKMEGEIETPFVSENREEDKTTKEIQNQNGTVNHEENKTTEEIQNQNTTVLLEENQTTERINQEASMVTKDEDAKMDDLKVRFSVKKKKSGKIRFCIKSGGVTGYQLAYSTDKQFKKNKTKVVNIKKDNIRIKDMKKDVRYYVRVRAYEKEENGRFLFGPWSKVKRVKIR